MAPDEGKVSFSKTLQTIVDRVEGGAGAVILGIDGIVIERYVKELSANLDLELIATELSTLLIRGMHTATDTGLGDLREMMFATELMIFLLRPITSEYFLLFGLNPGGNIGRARFELRKAQLALETEFTI